MVSFGYIGLLRVLNLDSCLSKKNNGLWCATAHYKTYILSVYIIVSSIICPATMRRNMVSG